MPLFHLGSALWTTILGSGELTAPFQGQEGFGWMLLKTALILIAVCILSYLVIKFWLRRFLPGGGRGSSKNDDFLVISRLMLEPRRSLQVVRVRSKIFLIGLSEGQITMLSELDAEDWPLSGEGEPSPTFKMRLDEIISRGSPNSIRGDASQPDAVQTDTTETGDEPLGVEITP